MWHRPIELCWGSRARAGLYEAATVRVNPTGSVAVMDRFPQPRPRSRHLVRTGRRRQARHPDRSDRHRSWRHRQGSVRDGNLRLALARRWGHFVNALNKIVDKGRKIAAHLLEAAEADIEFKNGAYTGRGTSKTFGEIALTAYVPHKYPIETIEPGCLEETAFYDPKNFS